MYPLKSRKVPNTHTLQPNRALAPVGDTSLDIMATAQAALMGLVALACASLGAAKHRAMDYTSIERWVWEWWQNSQHMAECDTRPAHVPAGRLFA